MNKIYLVLGLIGLVWLFRKKTDKRKIDWDKINPPSIEDWTC